MTDPSISFAKIIAPVAPEEFFGELWGRSVVHIPGAADKLSGLFSWGEVNRLLEMTKLWSDRSMKVVLDGRTVDPSEYSRPGQTREGNQALLPVSSLLTDLLSRGATVILDLIETLSPGTASIAAAIQSATGGAVVCNAYCSWNAHQGFPIHFDTTDVIALHFEGSKIWRTYEGRASEPVDAAGHSFASLSAGHHARARGKLVHEIEMRPGDVLYLPRGQYHEAIASSEASLHLSFGINVATGIDVMTLLARSLVDEELFRRGLPHFDRPMAHREHLRAMGERIRDILAQPALSDQVREWQRERALRDGYARFRLPQRERVATYRVRSLGVAVEATGEGGTLRFPGDEMALTPAELDIARWVMARDVFDARELVEQFADRDRVEIEAFARRLLEADILDAL